MHVLLSTLGSRGDVQPLLGVAQRLLALGHSVRACVPPDFAEGARALGIDAVAVGPEVRPTAVRGSTVGRELATPEGRKRLAEGTVAAQFGTIPAAARGCDLVVGCGALQLAARSAAELAGVGYVHVHYCPVTVPSPSHAPLALPGWPLDPSADPAELWRRDAARWNETWGAALDAHRVALGLPPVDDVRTHVFTERPWLAADPVLAPWPEPDGEGVAQTGAWLLPDPRPLPDELEDFLGRGEPPIYFGLGSMAAPGADPARAMVEAARARGRRAVVSRGWADLALPDPGTDCLAIGEVSHAALFPRVACAVHHGGAGTTTTAARAGVAQVIVPQRYDQPYWAERVEALDVGVAHAPGAPTAASLGEALERALAAGVAEAARSLAPRVRDDGAETAARLLVAEAAGPRR